MIAHCVHPVIVKLCVAFLTTVRSVSAGRRRCAAAAILGVAAFAPPAATAQDSVLHWSGGDHLSGRLVAADRETVSWQSGLFAEPLQIEQSALASATWPGQEPPAVPVAPMIFQMRNGDRINGQLTAVTDDEFEVQTERHGKLRLMRNQIRLVRTRKPESRADSFGLLYAGPGGLTGWRHPLISSWAEPPGWIEEQGGHLSTTRADAVMFLPLPFPARFEMEVILASTDRPSFVFSLGSNTETSMRLETWDDSLVACSNADFREVRKLPASLRRLHLLIFVDHTAHRMVVSSAQGEQLLDLPVDDAQPGNSGILIRNGAGDLTLEHLTVAQWDGSDFEGVKPDVSRVHLDDGTALQGQLQAVPDDPATVSLNTGDQSHRIPLQRIQGIVMHHQSEPERTASQITATWFDGEVLSGECLSATSESISLQTINCRQPVTSRLAAIQRLRFPAKPADPNSSPDRLFFPDGTLAGVLSIEDDSEQPLRWKPPGGRKAVALASAQPVRFQRDVQPSGPLFDSSIYRDVIYLQNNDVLPCRIEACSEQEIMLRSPFFEGTRIAARHVRAVELTSPRRVGDPGQGFGDSSWRRIVGSPDIQPESVTFRASEAIGHASILNGDVVEMTLTWTEQVSANVLLNLFTQIPSVQPGGPAIAFAIRDNSITVMDGSIDGTRRASDADREIRLPSRRAHVTIFRQGNKLRVSVNGQVAQTFEMEAIDRTSRALLIRASVINRRRSTGIRPATTLRPAASPAGGPSPETDTFVRISDFAIRDTVGNSIRHFIDEEARQITLTVPRFRREDPATHVLLSPTGDLLRGKLLGVDDKFVRFEAHHEPLQIDRTRVASIIWLTPPASPERSPAPASSGELKSLSPEGTPRDQPNQSLPTPEPADAALIQVLLDEGLALSMAPAEMNATELSGISPVLGRCHVPAAAVREVLTGQWNNDQTFVSYAGWDARHAADPQWQMPAADLQALELIGEPAPDLALPMLDGSPFRLSDHPGKILVLDFWASWCGPCVQGLPEVMEVTSRFGPDQVLLLAINLKETPQSVATFLDNRQLAPLTLLDRNGIAAAIYGVVGLPHTVIIGPDGFVEAVRVGYNPGSAAELQQIIRQLLEGTWQRPDPTTMPVKPNMPQLKP